MARKSAAKVTSKTRARASGRTAAKSAQARKTHAKAASGHAKAAPPKKKGTGRKALTIIDKSARMAKQAAAAAASADGAAKAVLSKNKKPKSVVEAASNVAADSKGYVFINGRRVRMISTKGHTPTKKPRENGAAQGAAASAESSLPAKPIKTKLGRKELTHYRDLLTTKRRELIGDLHAMENEALRSGGGGNISHMPIHMADLGTDTFDQDFMLGLAENERQQLREIDAALVRIEDGTYGVCQMTGKPIPKARLDAKPWAKYTIEAARQMEGQMGR